jgi:hypothetical protein
VPGNRGISPKKENMNKSNLLLFLWKKKKLPEFITLKEV